MTRWSFGEVVVDSEVPGGGVDDCSVASADQDGDGG